MKIIVFVFTLLSCQISLANDFRGLAFGSNCDEVETNEVHYGNVLRKKMDSWEIVYVFDGELLNQAAIIEYFCTSNNQLFSGRYLLKYIGSEKPIKAFNKLKKEYTNTYGNPAFDSTLEEIKEKIKLTLNMTEKELGYAVTWNLSKYKITINSFESRNNEYIVGVTFMSKEKFKENDGSIRIGNRVIDFQSEK